MKPAFMLPFISARRGSQKERTLSRATAVSGGNGVVSGTTEGKEGTDVYRVFRVGSRWSLPEPFINQVR